MSRIAELPASLARLLTAPTSSKDDAWAAFVAEYSRLFLSASRSVSTGTDQAMDTYAHILEQLRNDDCRRLRAYTADSQSKFTTWLVVVTRRICVDFHRSRYGRARAEDSDSSRERRSLRKQLQQLAAAPEDISFVVDESGAAPDRRVLEEELATHLQTALDTLVPSDKLLLALRYEEDLSASEIAKILHLPSQFHVYRRLNAVLGGLRGILRARGVESAAL